LMSLLASSSSIVIAFDMCYMPPCSVCPQPSSNNYLPIITA
jgi:uncharacterized protein (DUF1684 family)